MIDIKEFLTSQEGIAYNAYKDASGYSIGVGHFLTKEELASGFITLSSGRVSWKNGLTLPQIQELLAQDVDRVAKLIKPLLKTELNERQGTALVSFVFNVGVGAFACSTLLKSINNGDLADVPAQLQRWVYSSGTVNPGLVNRRKLEAEIWEGKL